MPIKPHAQHASPPASPEQIRDDVSRLAVEQRSLDQFNRICRRANAIRGGLFLFPQRRLRFVTLVCRRLVDWPQTAL
ncbi:MAG TPA: hypothetical protein VNU44_04690 [Bryobacteraceae bacterium]|jgi:hypothetical protein|nr:hypothetical protein [Bryobacteraceae bacterium]